MSSPVVRCSFLGQILVPAYRDIPDAVEVNPEGRWPWLQRKLMGLMRRLGARSPSVRIPDEVTTAEVNFDDIARMTCENREMMMRVHRKEARHIVMGFKQFAALARVKNSHGQFMMVPFPPHYQANVVAEGRRQPDFFQGMQVMVVPWFDGVMLLPEIEQPDRSESPYSMGIDGGTRWR